MKIDGSQSGDLLRQLQEAQQSARTSEEKKTSESTFSAHLQTADSAERAAPDPPSALETSIMQTAQDAIAGNFNSDAQVRRQVIKAIVYHSPKYESDAERNNMVEQLDQLLGTDPTFRRKIDEMLVMAATRLD